jgi:hypothetical protein
MSGKGQMQPVECASGFCVYSDRVQGFPTKAEVIGRLIQWWSISRSKEESLWGEMEDDSFR